MKKNLKYLILSLIIIDTIGVLVFGIIYLNNGGIKIKGESYVVPTNFDGHKVLMYAEYPVNTITVNEPIWSIHVVIIGTVIINIFSIIILIKANSKRLQIISIIISLLFALITFFIPISEHLECSQNGNDFYEYRDIYNIKLITRRKVF